MYFVNPKKRETFFLRLLLLHVRGAKSYRDMRTVNGIVCDTYEEACITRGLISNDAEWDKCLEEAALVKFPKSMCELFAYILVFQNPHNASELYNKYKTHFMNTKLEKVEAENRALKNIENVLLIHGMKLNDFNIKDYDENLMQKEHDDILCNYIDDNEFIETYVDNETMESLINTLTVDQKQIFDLIIKDTIDNVGNKLYFVDGPGGSGKSYLHNVIIKYLISLNITFLTIAWTGIAANLLINGKTVHSTFKLPLNINEQTTCNISPNSKYGIFLKNVKIIIWDEISMVSKHAFEAIDTFLRDLCSNNNPFGGKIIVTSGDFRQTLPIVRHGNRTKIMESCVKRSKLWSFFMKLSLNENLRLQNKDYEFKNWLLDVGENKNATKFELQNNVKKIPKELICDNDLITEIFGHKIDPNDLSLKNKVILSPLNSDILKINENIVEKIDGKKFVFYSDDKIESENDDNLINSIPTEFLNSLTPNGLPPHKLILKKGVIVSCLRNLDINGGLCNGTRMVIKDVKKHLLVGEIITGKYSGKIVLLPRIDLSPSLEEIPFRMIRRQFPIRLSFAMTINKSQGQSFDKVGIYLRTPVFSHGQLYVALSRATSKHNLKLLLSKESIYEHNDDLLNIKNKRRKLNIDTEIYTKNIVYSEIFAN